MTANASWSNGLIIELFGAPRAMRDGAATNLRYDKVRALLAYLAVETRQPLRRGYLANLLWPDSPEAEARHSLNQALFTLRQAIGDAAVAPPVLLVTKEAVHLNPAAAVEVDVNQFTALLDNCTRHRHADSLTCTDCAQWRAAAVGLYRTEFLQGFHLTDSEPFDEWSIVLRESLHRRALDALLQLTDFHEQRGEYELAINYARRQIELEPWREEAHCQLMRLLAASGQRAAALAQYEVCRRILRDELGVEPSTEANALRRQIEEGSGLAPPPASMANLVQVGQPIVALPPQLTSFVGRTAELAQIAAWLADDTVRLITLVGQGGIGKTRLAIQAAINASSWFAQGVCFVPLAAVASGSDVALAIAAAVKLPLPGGSDLASHLLEWLNPRTLLLLLDNFEQLLDDDDAVALVNDLLRHAPRLKILVTSREPLDLLAEQVMEIAGLATEPGQEMSALDLFLQRARRVRAGFTVDATNARMVAQICQLVSGVPLALELAAAWTRTLTCADIAGEIERSIDFLSTSARDVPPRQRSMRAVFDQSWARLDPTEQMVLMRLAVFRGGCSRDAAHAVTGATLSQLSLLVGRSLLQRGPDGRYTLHELVRQYAAGRLADATHVQAETAARHFEFYAALLRQREELLESANQSQALADLTLEVDNLRAAIQWAIANDRIVVARTALRCFAYFLELRNWFQEGHTLFAEVVGALRRSPNTTDAVARIALAHMLGCYGWFTFRIGQAATAAAILREALNLTHPQDDADVRSDLHLWLGFTAVVSGDFEAAQRLLSACIAIGDTYGTAFSQALMSLIELAQGDVGAAYRLSQQALVAWRQHGDPRGLIFALNHFSSVAALLGPSGQGEAQATLLESLAISNRLGDRWGMANAWAHLGRLAVAQGNLREAQRRFAESQALMREIGDRWGEATALDQLAAVACSQGEWSVAEDHYMAALREAAASRTQPVVLRALLGLATVWVRALPGVDSARRALVLAHYVLTDPASEEETRTGARQLTAALHAQLTLAEIDFSVAQAQHEPLSALVERLLAAGATL